MNLEQVKSLLELGFEFLMHRVELKVLLQVALSHPPNKFLMHRVELKAKLSSKPLVFTSTFLMHRVELKAKTP